jgi:hypothetical protein
MVVYVCQQENEFFNIIFFGLRGARHVKECWEGGNHAGTLGCVEGLGL